MITRNIHHSVRNILYSISISGGKLSLQKYLEYNQEVHPATNDIHNVFDIKWNIIRRSSMSFK